MLYAPSGECLGPTKPSVFKPGPLRTPPPFSNQNDVPER